MTNNNTQQRTGTYGLFTTIAMIVGIVVGSGIYFKADDILKATGGDMTLGLISLLLCAALIVTGSLSIAEFASRSDANGGLVGYFDEFVSHKMACGFGWFQTFVYYPSLMAVISWVCAIYTFILFGYKASFNQQILVAIVYIVVLVSLNILWKRLGGIFQGLTMVVKLIPLVIIAVVAIFWTQPLPALPIDLTPVEPHDVGMSWIAALVPLAFAYDGWVIATSIAPEVKNARRNLTIALIVSPLIILGIYLAFFAGLTTILGPSFIMTAGDEAISTALSLIFGPRVGNAMLAVVLISIVGVLNGLVIGMLRMPQAMASRGFIPDHGISFIHPRLGVSLKSAMCGMAISAVWMILHYVTQVSGVFEGRDVSEISIVFSYGGYALLYLQLLKDPREAGLASFLRRRVIPVLAIVGSALLWVGSLITNPGYIGANIIFCTIIFIAGIWYGKHHAPEKSPDL